MNKILTGAAAALTLAGTVAAGAAPAAAQPYRGYHGYHRGPGVGAVVGAGVLGLALGAAVAQPYGYGYYGAPYYGPGYYAPAYGYGYGYAPVYAYGPYARHHYYPYRRW